MPIHIHPSDEKDLMWYFRRFYETDMGKRSTHEGLVFAIKSCRAQMPGKSGDVSDDAIDAARRMREIRDRVGQCTLEQIAALECAFGYGDGTGLNSFGQYPRVALALTVVRDLKRKDPSKPDTEEVYLRRLVHQMRHGKRDEKRQAEQLVADLRDQAEKLLLVALLKYGARVDGAELPAAVSVNQLAQAVRMNRDNLRDHLETLGVRLRVGKNGYRISMTELRTRWPEAAEKYFNQFVVLHLQNNTAA